MSQKKIFLSFCLSLLAPLFWPLKTHAELTSTHDPSPFPGLEKESLSFQFVTDPKAKVGLGTSRLQFIEGKSSVLIQFEGRGLKKGSYQILEIETCQDFKKQAHLKKNSDRLVYSFQTSSGDISSESKISIEDYRSFDLSHHSLVLVKEEKNQKLPIACSQLAGS